MISIGTLGGPAIGTLQDTTINTAVEKAMPEVHREIVREQEGLFFDYQAIDNAKVAEVPAGQQEESNNLVVQTKQRALAKIAVRPAIMCGCYLVLVLSFKSRGGCRADVRSGHAAVDEKSTGGTLGPGAG
jgi:hypothetical protein